LNLKPFDFGFMNVFKWGEIYIIKKVSNSTGFEVKWWNLTTLKI
jgi:hypothetical protein